MRLRDTGFGLAGTERGMEETFGSTCHGAGRARSRNNSRNKLSYQEVLDALKTRGIAIRVASPKLVMEEAPESYKVAVWLYFFSWWLEIHKIGACQHLHPRRGQRHIKLLNTLTCMGLGGCGSYMNPFLHLLLDLKDEGRVA